MESAVGQTVAKELLDEIVADEKKQKGSADYGCICEIDLSQRKAIRKIMTRLLYPTNEAGSSK